MRKTITNWEELVEFAKQMRKENKRNVLLRPVSMYGVKDKEKREVKTPLSFLFEVVEEPEENGVIG